MMYAVCAYLQVIYHNKGHAVIIKAFCPKYLGGFVEKKSSFMFILSFMLFPTLNKAFYFVLFAGYPFVKYRTSVAIVVRVVLISR